MQNYLQIDAWNLKWYCNKNTIQRQNPKVQWHFTIVLKKATNKCIKNTLQYKVVYEILLIKKDKKLKLKQNDADSIKDRNKTYKW